MRFEIKPTRPLVIAGVVLLLQACSGGTEDPRVTLCRGLAAEFSGLDASEWSSDGNRFKRPEYAEARLKASAGETAACYYEFDASEELGLAGDQQFFDYSTLPYRMRFNGVEVDRASLKAAIMVHQNEVHAEALRQAKEAVEQARQQIQKAVEEAANSYR